MSKVDREADDDLRPEYDASMLGQGVRGKYLDVDSAIWTGADLRWHGMKPNHKDLAQFALLGRRFGILPLHSIVAWADSMIAESDIPQPWIIDLALANPDTVEDALHRVPGKIRNDFSIRLFLGFVSRRWRSGGLSIGQIRGIGWSLHCESVLSTTGDQADWGVCLEVEGEDFDEGRCTEDDLKRSIDEKLAEYSHLEPILPAWV